LIGAIIRFLISAACGLFVLSLPLSKTETGATLRRWAGVCFVLAFLPSLLCGLFYATSTASTSPTTPTTSATTSIALPAGDFFSTLGRIAAVILLGLLAYGFLKLRCRLISKPKPRDPWETFFNRGGGKRPFTMHSRVTRSRSPYTVGDDEDDD
jgi:hypothetical protein